MTGYLGNTLYQSSIRDEKYYEALRSLLRAVKANRMPAFDPQLRNLDPPKPAELDPRLQHNGPPVSPVVKAPKSATGEGLEDLAWHKKLSMVLTDEEREKFRKFVEKALGIPFSVAKVRRDWLPTRRRLVKEFFASHPDLQRRREKVRRHLMLEAIRRLRRQGRPRLLDPPKPLPPVTVTPLPPAPSRERLESMIAGLEDQLEEAKSRMQSELAKADFLMRLNGDVGQLDRMDEIRKLRSGEIKTIEAALAELRAKLPDSPGDDSPVPLPPPRVTRDHHPTSMLDDLEKEPLSEDVEVPASKPDHRGKSVPYETAKEDTNPTEAHSSRSVVTSLGNAAGEHATTTSGVESQDLLSPQVGASDWFQKIYARLPSGNGGEMDVSTAGSGVTARGVTARGGALGMAAMAPMAVSLLAPLVKEGISWVAAKLRKKTGTAPKTRPPTEGGGWEKHLDKYIKSLGRSSPWKGLYKAAEPIIAKAVRHPEGGALTKRFIKKHAKRMVGKGGLARVMKRANPSKRAKGYYGTMGALIHPLLAQYEIKPGGLVLPKQIGGSGIMDEVIGLISDPALQEKAGELIKQHGPTLLKKVGNFATGRLLNWWHGRRERREAKKGKATPPTPTPAPAPAPEAAPEPPTGTGPRRGVTLRETGAMAHGGAFGTSADQHAYSNRRAVKVYALAAANH